MSCKCFNKKAAFKDTHTFAQKYEISKCVCKARFCAIENRSKFTIDSKDIANVDKIKIDGYLDSSFEHKKCDYLFVYKDVEKSNKQYIFVELKGENITDAVKQIENTINIFIHNGYLRKDRVIGAIVNSRNPSNDGSYRKAKLQLEKKMSTKLKGFRIEKEYKTMTYDPINDKVIKK